MIKITDYGQMEKVIKVRDKLSKKFNMELCFKQLNAHNCDVEATIATLQRRLKSNLILPDNFT